MKLDGTGVLYIYKNKLFLYTNLLSDVVSLSLSERAYRDLIVTDTELFTKELNDFFIRIPKGKFVIVISDSVAVTKELSAAVINQHEVDSFLTSLPFEEVASKTIHTADGVLIFAVNKKMLQLLQDTLEQLDFAVQSVLPGMALSEEFGKQKELSFQMASEVFARALSLQRYNLMPPLLPAGMTHETHTMTPEERAQRRHDILRLYAYTTIFGLLVIAIVVVWNVQNPGPTQTYRGRANQPTPTLAVASPSATLTPLPSNSIKIINYSGNVDLAKKLQEQLMKDKFTNVTIENKQVSVTAKTTIIYSDKIPQNTRDVVFADVYKSLPVVSVQVTMNAPTPITIILGR